MRHVILIMAWCCLMLPAMAAQRPIIHACTEDNESWPWLLKERVGITTFHLQLVEKQLGGKLEVTPLPWKRCLAELKNGNVDAVFKISYSPARAAEIGIYPMQGEQVDARKRLLNDSYSLYHLKGDKVAWDGKTLKVDGPVGVQAGFSMTEQLLAMGARVDDGGRASGEHLRKLLLGRVAAVALQTEEGDSHIRQAEFKGKIEKIGPVLVEKPYFLIFSKQFYAHHTGYAHEVWNAIETVRESAEYKKFVQDFK
jgi:polar amino acid transport system substrate-binding protein